MTSSLNSFIQLLGVLLIFLFVLLLTWLVTRWLAGKQKGSVVGQNLQLIETISVSNGKCIQLVRAGKAYLVIAVGKEGVTMLAQLTEDQLDEAVQNDGKNSVVQESFQDVLDRLKGRFHKK